MVLKKTKPRSKISKRADLANSTPIKPCLLLHYGWCIKPTPQEVEPHQFFSLLANRQFPVVPRLRPLHALFCGFEPDFWHESVGHLAIITDQEFADFYQWCGTLVAEVKSEANKDICLANLFKVLWVMLEYGILKTQSGQIQAFGGALTSSYMALQRLKRGFIATVLFDPKAVLRSGLADEFPVKRHRGRIQLFHVDSLTSAKNILSRWMGI
jgi:phenylalanine-4-hydroxylase